MKEITVLFPSNHALADFILSQGISGLQTSSVRASLKGRLTDDQIALACTKYEGVVEVINLE